MYVSVIIIIVIMTLAVRDGQHTWIDAYVESFIQDLSSTMPNLQNKLNTSVNHDLPSKLSDIAEKFLIWQSIELHTN